MKTVQKQLNLKIKQTNQNKNKVDMESLRENHKEFIKSNKLTLKSSLRFRSEKHNVFIEEVNQIALSANDEKGIQSIGSIETCIWNKQRPIMYKSRN